MPIPVNDPEKEVPANYHFQDYAKGWSDSLDLALDIVESHAQNLHREGKHDAAREVLRLIDKLTPKTPKA